MTCPPAASLISITIMNIGLLWGAAKNLSALGCIPQGYLPYPKWDLSAIWGNMLRLPKHITLITNWGADGNSF